jgi:hypothetical protein
MKSSTRTVLAAAVIFALAMGALEHGGWWWAWLFLAVWALTGFRLPRFKLSRFKKLFLAYRKRGKDRRERRCLARQQRRAMKRHQ